MPDTDATPARSVERVTARVVLLIAGAFFLAGIGMVIREAPHGRRAWVGLAVMACALVSAVRARRKLAATA